MTSQSSTID